MGYGRSPCPSPTASPTAGSRSRSARSRCSASTRTRVAPGPRRRGFDALPLLLVPRRFVHRRRRRGSRVCTPRPTGSTRWCARRAASARSRPSIACAAMLAAGDAAGRRRLPPGALLTSTGPATRTTGGTSRSTATAPGCGHSSATSPGTGGSPAPYADAIDVAVRYLVATGTDTCRDWWEENRDQIHVATLAGVAAGLTAAVRMGTLPDRRRRRRRSPTLRRPDPVTGASATDTSSKWLDGTTSTRRCCPWPRSTTCCR